MIHLTVLNLKQCPAPPRTQGVENGCKNAATLDSFGFGKAKSLHEHSRQKDTTLKRPKTTLELLCTVIKKKKNLLTNTEVTEFAVHMLCKDIFREADDINSHNGSLKTTSYN